MSEFLNHVMEFLGGLLDLVWMTVAVAIALMILLLYVRRRRRGAAAQNGSSKWNAFNDIDPDRLMRLWTLLNSRGKVGLAVAAAALLAGAQFFTTRRGLSNFIPWPVVAVMAAIGIQVILYLAAWLVAERSADKAYLRRKRREEAEGLCEAEDLRRAETAVKSSGSVWTVLMFCTGLWVSVFFSFDALFDHVYLPAQQLLNNLKVARSTIGSVFGSMGKKIEEDRNAALEALTASKPFQTWQGNLTTILDAAEKSKDVLQAAWTADNNRLQQELADARQKLQQKQEAVAKAKAGLAVQGDAPPAVAQVSPDATEEIKQLEQRAAELQNKITDLERQRDDTKAKLDVENAAGGSDGKGQRRRAGKGPVWRELRQNLTAVETELAVNRRSLKEVQDRLESLRRSGAAAEQAAQQAAVAAAAARGIQTSELKTAEEEIKDLGLKVSDAEARYQAFVGAGNTAAQAMTGVGDQVVNLRRELSTFTGTGDPATYTSLLNGCNALAGMIERQDSTKQLLGTATCDAAALGPQIAKLTAFQDALVKYGQTCRVDDAFNAMTTVKAMVDQARVCAGVSSLPFSRISYERDEIDRVEQENSPNTSHFERAIATLSRGDKLAWLALAIAFSIDFLVLIAAMLGARAADHVAPQSVLDSVSVSDYIDLTVRDDDPTHIRNQKRLLSLIRDDFEPLPDGAISAQPIIELFNVPADLRDALQPILTTYVSNGMAQIEARRPGVYVLSKTLVTKLSRDVGSHERKRRGTSSSVAGRRAAVGGSAGAENPLDPMEPASFAARRRQRQAARAAAAERIETPESAPRTESQSESWQDQFRPKRYVG
jgi:hypothetical protein